MSLTESYKLLMIYKMSCHDSNLHLRFHYLNVMWDNKFVYIILYDEILNFAIMN